jgi:toxin ParE1/3/4
MRHSFHPEALAEYEEAIRYFYEIDPKLAEGFIEEIEFAINAICRNPITWRIVESDVRRYLVHRFPFGIYYTVENDFIAIWSVMHLARNPGYWKSRRSP